MTSALEVLAQARAAGLRLAPRGEKLQVVPTPPPELRAALANAKPEILSALRKERTTEVGQAIASAYDRLNVLGPWTPPAASAHRNLGVAVDVTGRAYIQGEGELDDFEAALRKWEAALSAGRMPLEADPAPGRSG